jgi:hypothetical protein
MGIDLGILDPLGIYDPMLAARLRNRIEYLDRLALALARKVIPQAETEPGYVPTTKQGKAFAKFQECYDTPLFAKWYEQWEAYSRSTKDNPVPFLPLLIRDTQELVKRNETEFMGYLDAARKCGLKMPDYVPGDESLLDKIQKANYLEVGIGAGIGMGTVAIAAAIALILASKKR